MINSVKKASKAGVDLRQEQEGQAGRLVPDFRALVGSQVVEVILSRSPQVVPLAEGSVVDGEDSRPPIRIRFSSEYIIHNRTMNTLLITTHFTDNSSIWLAAAWVHSVVWATWAEVVVAAQCSMMTMTTCQAGADLASLACQAVCQE